MPCMWIMTRKACPSVVSAGHSSWAVEAIAPASVVLVGENCGSLHLSITPMRLRDLLGCPGYHEFGRHSLYREVFPEYPGYLCNSSIQQMGHDKLNAQCHASIGTGADLYKKRKTVPASTIMKRARC